MSASEFWPGEHKVTPAAADEVDEAAVESVVGATVPVSAPVSRLRRRTRRISRSPASTIPRRSRTTRTATSDEAEDDEPAEEAEPLLRLAGHAPGDLNVPDDIAVLEGAPIGGRRGVGIVAARFNGDVTNRLLESALAELDRAGVPNELVTVMAVPGAFELPLGAMALAKTRRYSAIVALGCVIRGETAHFEYVAGEAASGLQLAALETGVPVAFGVLTVETLEQAMARSDKGAEAVRTALEMADLFAHLRVAGEAGRRIGYTPPPMSKVCSVCGKKPGFGNHRSHSMVATKRRFDPNLQRVRVVLDGKADTRVRLHPLPQGRKGPEGRLARPAALQPRRRFRGPIRAVEAEHMLSSPLGSITISSDAIAHIVGETALECYGVVGMAAKGPVRRLLGRERLTQGIQIGRNGDGGVTIDLHVVVEYGLNLAEVASTIRNRVGYEVGRLTGLPVRAVEVHIEDVRRSE